MRLPTQFIQVLTRAALLVGMSACADLSSDHHTQVASAHPAADCSAATGSRVSAADQPSTAPCRSFTNQDMRTTGAPSNAQALSMLDPSITTGR
jgi:hypothetical protein